MSATYQSLKGSLIMCARLTQLLTLILLHGFHVAVAAELPLLQIHPQILHALSADEVRTLQSKFRLEELSVRGAFGTITSVQTIDSTIRGSTAAGDRFVRNAQAQRFDQDMARWRQGGSIRSAQSNFMIAEFERFLGSQLNTPDVVQYTHRYAIKTLDGRVVTRDVVSSQQLSIPIGSCVSDYTASQQLEALEQRFCEFDDLKTFKAKFFPTRFLEPTQQLKSDLNSVESGFSVNVLCVIGTNPTIRVTADVCFAAGGSIPKDVQLKCKLGNNEPINLEPRRCLTAKGIVMMKDLSAGVQSKEASARSDVKNVSDMERSSSPIVKETGVESKSSRILCRIGDAPPINISTEDCISASGRVLR